MPACPLSTPAVTRARSPSCSRSRPRILPALSDTTHLVHHLSLVLCLLSPPTHTPTNPLHTGLLLVAVSGSWFVTEHGDLRVPPTRLTRSRPGTPTPLTGIGVSRKRSGTHHWPLALRPAASYWLRRCYWLLPCSWWWWSRSRGAAIGRRFAGRWPVAGILGPGGPRVCD